MALRTLIIVCAVAVGAFVGLVFTASQLAAQPTCVTTASGQVLCTSQQPVINGDPVSEEVQRELGLVVLGGCSGTLLNRYWVLTARHCVTTNGQNDGPLRDPGLISLSAAWSPDTAVATRIYELETNRRAVTDDIALVFFGAGDLGPVEAQPLLSRQKSGIDVGFQGVRLGTSRRITVYGRGRHAFAVPPTTPSQRDGKYRTWSNFRPSSIRAASRSPRTAGRRPEPPATAAGRAGSEPRGSRACQASRPALSG